MAVINGYALDEVVFGPQYGPTPLYGYEPDPPVPSSAAYRMRARDTTLAAIVYWNSDQVDVLGVDYGGPGPLTDVVVKEKA